MLATWRRNWPEYALDGVGLGIFMLSAGAFAALLQHPGSPVRAALDDDLLRRALMGLAMGLTMIAIVYSPIGRRSGAHLNPVVTLVFLRLGKVAPADALGYVVGQVLGGLCGVWLAAVFVGAPFTDPPVRWAATLPGSAGLAAAFAAEATISFVLMFAVLTVTDTRRIAHLAGVVAAALVATWITVEEPFSGMSMNPTRSLVSALPAGAFDGFWVYCTAPLCGMLLAAETRARWRRRRDACAKLHHDERYRCIFCEHVARSARGAATNGQQATVAVRARAAKPI